MQIRVIFITEYQRKKKTYSTCDSKNVVHAFVTSHKADFCSALLYGLPKYQHQQLQGIFDCDAKLTYQSIKYNHITPFFLLSCVGYQLNSVLMISPILHYRSINEISSIKDHSFCRKNLLVKSLKTYGRPSFGIGCFCSLEFTT